MFLTLALLAVVTLVNFAAALRGYQSSMIEAERLFSQRMRQQIDLLDYTLPNLLDRGDIEAGLLRQRPASILAPSQLEFQWFENNGTLLARSQRMPEAAVAALTEGSSFANFGGYRWHVLVAQGSDQKTWIVLAERDDQRYRMAESIILPAVYPMLLAIPILGLIILSLLWLGLRPVARLAGEMEQREATDLRPLAVADMPAELKQLALSANRLLARLEASFAREKRFSADVAHELRTPIAALSIQCENLILDAPEHTQALEKLRAGIQRMSHLVQQILILNRVAPDHYLGHFAALDLLALARQSISLQVTTLVAKQLHIECAGVEAWIMGDTSALQSLLGNLLGNAIKYTPRGGHIHLSVAVQNESVRLSVWDDGSGIPLQQRERVFDRFYRGDGDRHPTAEAGCGLGLSIVKQVVELHQASIQLMDSPLGTGLRVDVVFARAPPEGGLRHGACTSGESTHARLV